MQEGRGLEANLLYKKTHIWERGHLAHCSYIKFHISLKRTRTDRVNAIQR
jgi:hypothetical protein